ncbi:MAG: hypothetical protein ACI4CS_00055 [Candidatus Weimeria sp.]
MRLGVKQEAKKQLLVAVYQLVEFMRYGKHHVVVGYVFYELRVTLHLPFLRKLSLTSGAVSVVT